MKRTLLDITQKISRNPQRVVLSLHDLNNSTHWIFEATGWKFVDILREIEYRSEQDRLRVFINTQNISPRDYITEQGPNGLLVKFIKESFEYSLDSGDFIEIKGDIERYA
jgi:hypothetical protein